MFSPSASQTNNDLPIGVFDSGVGGLTVVQALRERLPQESILYLGDTARVPYGNKGAQTIRHYAINAANLLVERGVKALVIACNTASAYGLEALLERLNVPVLGVIEPVAKEAIERSQTGAIAVIGTRGTISSGSYRQALLGLNPQAQIIEQACPLFVPLAEEGWVDGVVVQEIAKTYFTPLLKSGAPIDTLILGCTHYPILRAALGGVLDELMPRHVSLLDCAQSTSQALKQELERLGLCRDGQGLPTLEFLVTDEPSHFLRQASTFFKGRLSRPEHVNIAM